jgi:hypothetical protein
MRKTSTNDWVFELLDDLFQQQLDEGFTISEGMQSLEPNTDHDTATWDGIDMSNSNILGGIYKIKRDGRTYEIIVTHSPLDRHTSTFNVKRIA